jgi:heparan-alpha-glucosaminide N-acetyltransferase
MVETRIAKPDRIVSLDIFRGLNLAVMIFVNELAEIKGLPWWTYHAPAKVDVMTYVDMVFPAFLLIVGMSLPLAIGARVRRGDDVLRLVWYVVLRAVALLVLGIILANGAEGDPRAMHGLGPFAWGLLALLGAVLIWFDYPKDADVRRRRLYTVSRSLGLLLLIVLAVIFRRTHYGVASGLSYGYPEILGLIGYTYFVTALCYLCTRRWRWAPAIWFIAFAAYNVVSTAGMLRTKAPWWIWPVQNGSMGALMFAGIVLSIVFFAEPRLDTFRKKATVTLLFGAAAAITAYLTIPLGISKIRATPTWMLYTVAACCAAYTALYWICDVRKQRAWAAPVRSAGANTLATYLLPDLWFYVLGATGFHWRSEHLNHGVSGVVSAMLFTAVMLALSALLTRIRFRLQL